MSFWWWVLVFVGISIGALAVFALLGLRLWRKSRILIAAIGSLTANLERAELAMRPSADADDDEWVAAAAPRL